ncbi:hypothetical protein BN77_2258 [Rhizobium mesoamericanum STM3625]|uniref:Uncharacterized protein n=1 Tax=Rhizobium mesoamericanum STM3625 TaxID=1211777 RepID=K0PME5_9HYPH|nr:hypothetical protein BN77_2258 [Rhizobium mesoamericanum STM3625]
MFRSDEFALSVKSGWWLSTDEVPAYAGKFRIQFRVETHMTADDCRLWRQFLNGLAAVQATLSRQHFYPKNPCMFSLSQ